METYTQGSSRGDKFNARYQDRFNLKIDKDWSIRETRLRILKMFLDGSIYDELSPFYQEYSGGNAVIGGVGTGSYIPLSQRRPSVTYRIPKIIVDESVSMLFGEEHFPSVHCEHEETTDFLEYINEDCNLRYAMINAAKIGSIGSVCVVIKVLNKKFHFEVLGTRRLTPVFDQMNPDVLLELTEKRKIDGASLTAQGYKIPEDDKKKHYYVMRKWTATEEIYYKPYKAEEEEEEGFKPKKDDEKSSEHGLGFLPAVWIKNTPNSHHIDGDCTFEPAIDISTEIDYQLSQLGRLLKYNSDPTLVIKNPSSLEGNQLIKSVGAINLDEKGDAYLLEMSNASTTAVIEYVRCLREFALESVRGNRANPDKLSSIHSGKALQMLNSNLISLVSEMRLTYGEYGLTKIYQMIMEIYFKDEFELDTDGYAPMSIDCAKEIELKWPDWYAPTPQDKLQEQQALLGYVTGGILSKETARENIQDKYHILDIEEESNKVANDSDEALKYEQDVNTSKKGSSMGSSKSGDVDRG